MKFLTGFLCLMTLALVAGCGGDKRTVVKGKITVGGKGPLSGGNIRFVSASEASRFGSGIIKADGTYEVSNAPVGDCKIVIDNTHLDPSAKKSVSMPGMPGMKGMGGMKGMPGGGGGGPGKGNAKDTTKKMSGAPSGVDVATEMGRADTSGQKFVKIDAAYAKPETTPLTFKVESGDNSKDFDVK